jgi:hypothetical protein
MEEQTTPIQSPLQEATNAVNQAIEKWQLLQQEVPQPMEWDHREQTEDKPQLRRGVNANWDIQKEPGLPVESPLFKFTADALDMSMKGAVAEQPRIERIINKVVNMIHDDAPDSVFTFISQQLRKSNGRSLRALEMRLNFLEQELG